MYCWAQFFGVLCVSLGVTLDSAETPLIKPPFLGSWENKEIPQNISFCLVSNPPEKSTSKKASKGGSGSLREWEIPFPLLWLLLVLLAPVPFSWQLAKERFQLGAKLVSALVSVSVQHLLLWYLKRCKWGVKRWGLDIWIKQPFSCVFWISQVLFAALDNAEKAEFPGREARYP